MLIKWRPDVWWWAPVVILRALLLCLTHAVSQEGERQLFWQLAILLTYGGCAAVLKPWRGWSANILDLEVTASLIIFLSLGCNFVQRYDWLDESVGFFGVIVSFLPAGVFVLTSLWIVFLVANEEAYSSKDEKLSDDVQAAFAKFVGLDQKAAEAFIQRLSWQDSQALEQVWFTITTELLREPGGSRHHQWLARGREGDPSFQGPRPALDEEDHGVLFDTGDMVEGVSEPTKWSQDPPRRSPPIPASRGGADIPKPAPAKPAESSPSPRAEVGPLPSGWGSAHRADGRTYYFEKANPMGTSTWKRPTEPCDDKGAGTGIAPAQAPPAKDSLGVLPAGWASASRDGKEYYYQIANPTTTTTWTRPTSAVTA